ncbi:hypothetical protein DFJ73DRAFT_819779 [Zopfochytrium polystomum]|nr:hypothetical protein DFJ73DRAFT_819779 [Zopfochytrium polystomum]
MAFSVYQIVPTITLLRISESEEGTFVLVALISLLVKFAVDFCSDLLAVARKRSRDTKVLAMVAEALKGNQDLVSRFHRDLANHTGLLAGAITTVLFFCHDTPLQRLSPACAERLRLIGVRHTLVRSGVMMFCAVAIDALYFARQLWVVSQKRRAVVSPAKVEGVDVISLTDQAMEPSFLPSLGCACCSGLAGGAVAAGISACCIAYLRGLFGVDCPVL